MAFIVYSNRDVWMTTEDEDYANECYNSFLVQCGNCTMREGSVEEISLELNRLYNIEYYA